MNGPAQNAEIITPWSQYLSKASEIRSDSVARQYLYQRLRNLLNRGLLQRSGVLYSITEAGLAWLGGVSSSKKSPSPSQQILELAQQQKEQLRETLLNLLQESDPYALERLVGDLLRAMGYEEVIVTARSNAPKSLVLQIAGATSVEWRLCRDVVEWSPGNVTAFYDFAEKAGYLK